MGKRLSNPYDDMLTTAKLEQLLEQFGADEFTGSRTLADHLVSRSNQCEFLTSKGQVRITFDLRPPANEPAESGPVEL
ncbi:MAG TPA: hypothetical protein VIP28_13245 [Nocardioides sp.]